MFDFILKILFIFLWASAFVAAKLGLSDAGPFSMLAVRFIIVSFLFALIVLIFKAKWPKITDIPNIIVVGILLHGFYLGGVFFAISKGTSAGLSSLVVSIHPILTCFLAVILIKESITIEKWIGIFLGFFGMIIVIWPRLGGELPLIGFISCCVALTAISFGTVIQKRYLEHMEILGGNTIQAISAAIFFALGVCYFWPNMIGFIAEKIPLSGALGMSIVGAMGMFSTSIFQPIIGGWIDSSTAQMEARGLSGADLDLAAGQATLTTMISFPGILIILFTILLFWQKKAKTVSL